MCIENVLVAKLPDPGELLERIVQASRERDVFEPPKDIEVIFLFEIAEITATFEVSERIERHGLASRQ